MQSISLIIPCKNERQHLPRLAACIEKLRLAPAEVQAIVVDNGSDDGSKQFLAEQMSQITLIESQAGSAAAVRNEGAKLATGELLVFIDADVVLADDWLEQLRRLLEQQPDDRWLSGSQVLEPKDEPCFPRHWYDESSHHSDDTHVNSGHMLMPRSVFDELKGFDERLISGEDYDISVRAKQLGCRLSNHAELVAFHYGFPTNLRGFLQREAWHGLGDLDTFSDFLHSKVAILSAIFLAAHFALLLTLLTEPAVAGVAVLIIFSICALSTLIKFGLKGLILRPGRIVIYYGYFVGRSLSFYRRLRSR